MEAPCSSTESLPLLSVCRSVGNSGNPGSNTLKISEVRRAARRAFQGVVHCAPATAMVIGGVLLLTATVPGLSGLIRAGLVVGAPVAAIGWLLLAGSLENKLHPEKIEHYR